MIQLFDEHLAFIYCNANSRTQVLDLIFTVMQRISGALIYVIKVTKYGRKSYLTQLLSLSPNPNEYILKAHERVPNAIYLPQTRKSTNRNTAGMRFMHLEAQHSLQYVFDLSRLTVL